MWRSSLRECHSDLWDGAPVEALREGRGPRDSAVRRELKLLRRHELGVDARILAIFWEMPNPGRLGGVEGVMASQDREWLVVLGAHQTRTAGLGHYQGRYHHDYICRSVPLLAALMSIKVSVGLARRVPCRRLHCSSLLLFAM